jgi:hypothetical protein
VDVITRVPGPLTGSPQAVNLTIDRGPSTTLHVTATGAGGHSSQATINSADGKQIALLVPRYSCGVPPLATFCPVQTTTTATSYQLSFSATRATPMVLAAGIESGSSGRVSLPAATPTKSAPPYPTTTVVLARAPKTSKATVTTVAGSSATVGQGDSVVALTKVAGKRGMAPQKITVSIDRGPSNRLTITASIPRGNPSRATLSTTNGKAVKLGTLHYLCYLPPARTICPAVSTTDGQKQYVLVFSVVAGTPILLSAVVAQ